jgi:response regulator RpfG family c-di-GMP phosphodiesterase
MSTAPDPANQTLLIVDDSESAIQALEALLLPLGHRTLVARSGQEALEIARVEKPDMMLLDVMMPGMNGFEVCQAIRTDPETRDLPVVMVTALQDRESRITGLNVGADDFLSKPVDRLELRTRVRATLRADRYRRQLEQRQAQTDTLGGAIALMRDILSMAEPTIFGQSQRMERMARDLGQEIGYSPLWELEVATLLAQVGRVTIPNEVNALAETPHKLNAKEKRLLQSVPDIGSSLLGHIPGFERISEIVGYQDKRFDGTGYPAGQRSGKDIPLGSRIIRLVRDVLKGEEGGLNRRAALRQCEDMPGHHDPDLLELATTLFTEQAVALELLPLRDLRPGMLTCSSIMDSTGRVMVAPGLELTAPLLKSLENFHARVGLIEPFEVQIPTEASANA